MDPEPFVRPYRPSDLPDVADICVKTAHNGEDSTSLYPDTELMPSIFSHPYVRLEPEVAHVLDDGRGRAVGYILGTADTVRFVRRFREEWLPEVAGTYPLPAHEPRTPTEEMIGLLHRPERMVQPELSQFPAHLHIDLLPTWQGRGFGRALMESFFATLRAKDVAGVHLCMVKANTKARAFYDRLGFQELAVPDPGPVWYLGRTTAQDA
ncbi:MULTISPECIES: GNAT family N-acetyltransferase [unclassified Streptomyces]|uniref:GNAT family N-acetyltransferase n=1 Tax=unclassified Streptomyces TaxID=2593676 RepID=UPI0036ECDD32